MGILRTVSVGQPQEREWAGIGRTSIDKRAVAGPVIVRELGLDGDQVSDTRHHGGVDKAVSAYAREDLDFWEGELGIAIRDGQFGENLTTEGLDLNGLSIGTTLRVGDPAGGALLQVGGVRTPCNDFKAWMGQSAYDSRAWVKRFTVAGQPGPYLRVLESGAISAGDHIEIVHAPSHAVTVRDVFAALTTERHRLPELLGIEGLAANIQQKAEDFVNSNRAALPQP